MNKEIKKKYAKLLLHITFSLVLATIIYISLLSAFSKTQCRKFASLTH